MTEEQLNALLEIMLERSQSVTEEYLIRMGEQIQEIGELIPSSVNRLVQLKKMHTNLDAIKKEIARLAEISMEDLEKVLEAAQAADARFVAAEFGNAFRDSIMENTALKQILKSQLKVTAGEMANLSRTTIASESYRKVVDKAVTAVQMGVEDYNSAIRRTLIEAAGNGLRVTYPSGRTMRLDSAVRMNVLDGVRSLNNATMMELGEQFGADGIEISAHRLCAEDHLPYQGQQYSMEAFEDLQKRLPRPFGMWNCKHSMHPILLGISPNAYSEEELKEYREYSTEKIEIDGVTKTRYEWTQQQRRIETAVRYQKNAAIAAQAAGDNVQRRRSQLTINALMDRYDRVSEAAGIHTEYNRMRVDGFKAMGKRELQKAEKSDILNSIRETIRSDSVSKSINAEKQDRHIKDSEGYVVGRSYIYGDLETAQHLVSQYSGTGEPQTDKNGRWKNKEVVTAGSDIGVNVDKNLGTEISTNRFVIHYSKTGTHIVPTSRKE